ncbi:MAG: UPF0175 family protein [Pyrinomonadaceae bacterium]
MTHTLTIDYNDEILLAMGASRERFSAEAKFLLAAKLYELGRISSGQAARLAGKTRVDFLLSLASIGVPTANLTAEDIQTDIDFAVKT